MISVLDAVVLSVDWVDVMKLLALEARPVLVLHSGAVAISDGVCEPLGCGMGALHAVRPLRPVSRVSERLSLLYPLIYQAAVGHTAVGTLLELIEVLLLLIEGRAVSLIRRL